jgi:hypothetical protein
MTDQRCDELLVQAPMRGFWGEVLRSGRKSMLGVCSPNLQGKRQPIANVLTSLDTISIDTQLTWMSGRYRNLNTGTEVITALI